jgi:hypothetical protein
MVAIACACGAAHAADLYRWTDADGRVAYGDKPPKNARDVSRIDVDTATTTIPSRPAPAPVAPGAAAAAPPAPDLLTQRRATRARLEAGVAQARARLDLARKNLAEASDMAPGEQQSVVEKVADLPPSEAAKAAPSVGIDPGNMQIAGGGMYGMSVSRQNCSKVVGPSGKGGIICPTIIPNQAYRERIAMLEDAVKKAEADLDAALDAYRRGVD